MADMMNFPKRWEDFLHDYEFEDSRRVYTNGARLIQSFRVKQMMEHYATVRHGRWEPYHEADIGYDEYGVRCSNCGFEVEVHEVDFIMNYCPKCGTKMDGGSDG